MNIRTMAVAFSQESLPFDLNALYSCLARVSNQRDQPEKCYRLTDPLLIVLLAKLAGLQLQTYDCLLGQASSAGVEYVVAVEATGQATLKHLELSDRLCCRSDAALSTAWVSFFDQALEPNGERRGRVVLALEVKNIARYNPHGRNSGCAIAGFLSPQLESGAGSNAIRG